MNIRLPDGEGAATGILALVVAIVEILHELLCRQAVRRMEGSSLGPDRSERLGTALAAMAGALARLKEEHGIEEAVGELREGLDALLDEVFALDVTLEEESADVSGDNPRECVCP